MFPNIEKRFRVLGIDPGSNATGFSVIDFDPETGQKTIVYQYTLTTNEAIAGNEHVIPQYGEREARYMGYKRFMNQVLDFYNPDVVACEAPFLHRMPQAFKVLSELTSIFRHCVIEWNYTRDFVIVPPTNVKKCVGVKAKSNDKEDMRRAVMGRTDLSYAEGVTLDNMTEHAVDALCVTLWFLTLIFGDA